MKKLLISILFATQSSFAIDYTCYVGAGSDGSSLYETLRVLTPNRIQFENKNGVAASELGQPDFIRSHFVRFRNTRQKQNWNSPRLLKLQKINRMPIVRDELYISNSILNGYNKGSILNVWYTASDKSHAVRHFSCMRK